jgi:hypothetical protein
LRKAGLCAACIFALLAASCAKNDSVVSRLEGAEPQRLSFGTPAAVQKSFIDQMQACWFNGSSALLSGFHFDTKAAVLETSGGLTELPQITISSDSGSAGQSFVIQFYPFNDNTLISTRNVSFPVELAGKLKRDVETWIFGRNGCDEPAPAAGASAPRTSSAAVQQTAGGSWAVKPESPQAVR